MPLMTPPAVDESTGSLEVQVPLEHVVRYALDAAQLEEIDSTAGRAWAAGR